jgi:hypothetical protein
VVAVADFQVVASEVGGAVHFRDRSNRLPPRSSGYLCVTLCPLWFRHLHFINHKAHEGTRKKNA